MTRLIQEGDKVTLHWRDSRGGSASMVGVVVSVPQAPGDSWFVKEDSTGNVHMINHRAASFVNMVKGPVPSEETQVES